MSVLESIQRLSEAPFELEAVYRAILEESLLLTESQAGWIAECTTDYPPHQGQAKPTADLQAQTVGLVLRAITHDQFSAQVQQLWESYQREERSFHQSAAAIVQVQRTREPYFFSEDHNLPAGHPAFGACMVQPLFFGPRMVAILALTRSEPLPYSNVDHSLFYKIAGSTLAAWQQPPWAQEWLRTKQENFAANQAQLRDLFLANLSHELRTPLNGIINMTKFLKETPLSVGQLEYLETVEQCGVQLLAVVNDVIDYSKITSHKMTLAQQELSLRQCLEDSLEMVSSEALKKGLALSFNIDPAVPPSVKGDAKRLRQILINLLSNAVKFTEKGQIVITLTARLVQAEVPCLYEFQFSVQDSGVGIAPEFHASLFDSFAQLDYSKQGSGLGLAISKQLAELMGGKMWLESELGVGSVFHFTIVAEEFVDEEAVRKRASTLFKGKQVLIVDDNATNRLILFNLVLSWDMQPSLASSAEEAMMYVKSKQFDIGFIDIRMPAETPLKPSQTVPNVKSSRSLINARSMPLGRVQVYQYATTEQGVRLAQRIRDSGIKFPLIAISSIGIEFEGSGLFAARLSKPVREKRLFELCEQILCSAKPCPPPLLRKPTSPRLQSDLRLLIAEDQPSNQKVMQSMLCKLGYLQHDLASSGQHAVQLIEESKRQHMPYDAVLLDIRLPQLSGTQVADRICQLYPNKRDRPFIIAVTASVLEQDKIACRDHGMNGYIAKPIVMAELETMLQLIAERRGKHATPPALIL